jgi:hypothetical protein
MYCIAKDYTINTLYRSSYEYISKQDAPCSKNVRNIQRETWNSMCLNLEFLRSIKPVLEFKISLNISLLVRRYFTERFEIYVAKYIWNGKSVFKNYDHFLQV